MLVTVTPMELAATGLNKMSKAQSQNTQPTQLLRNMVHRKKRALNPVTGDRALLIHICGKGKNI